MPKDINQNEVAETANFWWLFLIQGISAVIIGWLLLVSPVATVLSLVVFLGLYWLISGIMEVIFSFFDAGTKGSKWGLKLLGGIIGIIAGLFVLNNPIFAGVLTPVMLMYIVAFTFIFNGIIKMVVGRQERDDGKYDWSWGSFFLGIFYLVFGLVLIGSPVILSTASLVFAAALMAIVGGIGTIIVSFKVRGVQKEMKKKETVTSAK